MPWRGRIRTDPEVAQLCVAGERKQDILRLQVAVDDVF